MKVVIALCAVLLFATTAAGDNVIPPDTWPPLPRWVIGPASVIERCSSPDTLECTANNGWGLCEQLADEHIGRIHIVYTMTNAGATKVFTRYTDNRGRNWCNPVRLSPNLESSDSSRDAAIACLGCSVAVAFYDDWTENRVKKRHMVYRQSLSSGERWTPPYPLSDHDDRQYDNRHPSVAVTWRQYGAGDREGPLARVVWVDSFNPPGNVEIRQRPTYLDVKMKEVGTSWWEAALSDTWGEYPSVCWNGKRDNVNEAWITFAGSEEWNYEESLEIFGSKSIAYAPQNPHRLTYNNYYDGRPCIQTVWVDPRYDENDVMMDTVLIAYESKPGGNTRIWLMWCTNEFETVCDRREAFPNFWPGRDLYRPNIWRRPDTVNANDTVFMVFGAEYSATTGPAVFWTISTDRGRTWKRPERLLGPRSPNASIIGGYRYANVLASLHRPSLAKHFLVFFPLNYIPAVALDALSPPPTARLIRQDAQSSANLWCAAGSGEYPVVLSSTNNGLQWENCGSPGWGGTPALALDSDTIPVCAYLDSNALYCSQPIIDKTIWTPVRVYEAAAGEVIGYPSVSLYPGKVGGVKVAAVTFAVYDTVNGSSRIMFAKVDSGNVILDTVASRGDLCDSFPCINICNTDSIYITWQDSGAVKQAALYDYPAGSGAPPPAWTGAVTVAKNGRHPMSICEGNVLHCVWTELHKGGSSDTAVICKASLNLNDAFGSGWTIHADASEHTTAPKDNGVAAGCGVVVWQEKIDGKWAIRCRVRDSVRTLVLSDTDAYHPHAVAESSSTSPSVDQIRVYLLWTQGVVVEVDSGVYDTGETRFKVESLNVSHAGADATAENAGCKLIRKTDSDSLFSVYTDFDGAVVFARSADGNSWVRQVLDRDMAAVGSTTEPTPGFRRPAIAEDGAQNLWLVTYNGRTRVVEARFRQDTTWSEPQTVYELSPNEQIGGAIAIAGSRIGTGAFCAFATSNTGAPASRIIVAKFNGDSVGCDTVVSGNRLSQPTLAVTSQEDRDFVHLCWQDNGDIKYTMSDIGIPSTECGRQMNWLWKPVVALSSTQARSESPYLGADQTRLVVAWSENGDIMVRTRTSDSNYDSWEDTLRLCATATASLWPTVAMGESVVVVWEEQENEDDHDIMASVEFGPAFVLQNTPTLSKYPHVLFQNRSSGDTLIPTIHVIWSEKPEVDYYEVRYAQRNLKTDPPGGGQQSDGNLPFIQPKLHQCAPNPFARRTLIRYQIGQSGNVYLRIYDAGGRLVKTLQQGYQKPGTYAVQWDGTDNLGQRVTNGIYFYRLEAPGICDTKKTVMMK